MQLPVGVKHVQWYSLVPVCFWNLTPPALLELYRSVVRNVNVCWYDTMELSPLDRSVLCTK